MEHREWVVVMEERGSELAACVEQIGLADQDRVNLKINHIADLIGLCPDHALEL